MSSYLPRLFAALKTAVFLAWPDVPEHGVYEAAQIERVPWEDLVTAGIPYAVLSAREMTRADWGLVNRAYEVPVEVFYVGESAGLGRTVLARLETLRDTLLYGELAYGQVLEVEELSTARELPPNELFTATNWTYLAGRLSLTVVVGETPA